MEPEPRQPLCLPGTLDVFFPTWTDRWSLGIALTLGKYCSFHTQIARNPKRLFGNSHLLRIEQARAVAAPFHNGKRQPKGASARQDESSFSGNADSGTNRSVFFRTCLPLQLWICCGSISLLARRITFQSTLSCRAWNGPHTSSERTLRYVPKSPEWYPSACMTSYQVRTRY